MDTIAKEAEAEKSISDQRESVELSTHKYISEGVPDTREEPQQNETPQNGLNGEPIKSFTENFGNKSSESNPESNDTATVLLKTESNDGNNDEVPEAGTEGTDCQIETFINEGNDNPNVSEQKIKTHSESAGDPLQELEPEISAPEKAEPEKQLDTLKIAAVIGNATNIADTIMLDSDEDFNAECNSNSSMHCPVICLDVDDEEEEHDFGATDDDEDEDNVEMLVNHDDIEDELIDDEEIDLLATELNRGVKRKRRNGRFIGNRNLAQTLKRRSIKW